MSKSKGAKLANTLQRKAKRESIRIARGVAKEGARIATGAVKGFLNVFNPFR